MPHSLYLYFLPFSSFSNLSLYFYPFFSLVIFPEDALRDNEHFKWLSKLEALTSWEEWVPGKHRNEGSQS